MIRKGKTYEEIFGKEKADKLKKKLSNSHKGHKPSDISRLKMSESAMGKPKSSETKLKISLAKKGKCGHKQSMKTRKKISERLKGRPKSIEHNMKNSESQKGKKHKPCSSETKKKMSLASKGKPKSIEHRNNISRGKKKLIQELGYVPGWGKYNNTKPELETEKILQKYNLNYKKQFRINYLNTVKLYDFYLPDYNILLEIDGTYWHSKGIKDKDIKGKRFQDMRINDQVKDKLAQDNGYTLIRIWEDELDQLDQYCDIMLFYRKKEVS